MLKRLLPNKRSRKAIVFDPRRPLLFLHIPKSAGTSFTQGLVDAVQPGKAITSAFDDVLFGNFRDFDSMVGAERERIYVGDNKLPIDADFVAGHFSLNTLQTAYPTGQIITVMREPYSRLLSHWKYWKAQARHDLSGIGKWADRVRIANGSFHEFLNNQDIICTTDNLYIRMILHPHKLIPVDAPIGEAHDELLLSMAKKRLRELSMVQCLENPYLIENISRWIGSPFTLARINVTETQPENEKAPFGNALHSEMFDIMDRRTRLDRVLWKETLAGELPKNLVEFLERKSIIKGFVNR